ncbi:MAG: plasmid stabilization protein [Pseudomonadota bacterium]
MTSLTIRKIDPFVKERLRVRAAEHGHSMEEEVRRILSKAVAQPKDQTGADLYQAIRARFEPLGGVDLELPPRTPMRDPPNFEE